MTFEDRLLVQLQQVVAADPVFPAGSHRRLVTSRRLVLVGAGAASAAAAIALVAGGDGSNAYALDTQPDGSVTVHINSLRDASGLQASLRRAGIPAVVDYSPGCMAPATAPAPNGDGSGPSLTRESGDGSGPSFSTGGTQAGGTSPHGDVARAKVTSSVRTDQDGTTFTLDPGQIKTGEKVYITTSTGRADAIGISIGSGVAPGCPSAP